MDLTKPTRDEMEVVKRYLAPKVRDQVLKGVPRSVPVQNGHHRRLVHKWANSHQVESKTVEDWVSTSRVKRTAWERWDCGEAISTFSLQPHYEVVFHRGKERQVIGYKSDSTTCYVDAAYPINVRKKLVAQNGCKFLLDCLSLTPLPGRLGLLVCEYW